MNGQSKIGARELEIVIYLQEKGKALYAQLLLEFAPRPGAYNIVENRLQRLSEKGLVRIERDGSAMVVRPTVACLD